MQSLSVRRNPQNLNVRQFLKALDKAVSIDYNYAMLFISIETYLLITLVAIVAVQYAFALLCLVKLAYMDIGKREYVLWNLLILLVFFIGGIIFLVYYYKKGKDRCIKPYEASEQQSNADSTPSVEDSAVVGNAAAAETTEPQNNDVENDAEAPNEQSVEQPDSEEAELESAEEKAEIDSATGNAEQVAPESVEQVAPVIDAKKPAPKKPRAAKKPVVKTTDDKEE